MIKKIIISLILGLVTTTLIMQNDPLVHAVVERHFKDIFQAAGKCHLEGTIHNVNLLVPSVELVNVHISSVSEKKWNWHAKKFRIGCSWLHVICFGLLDLQVEVDDAYAESSFDQGNLAFMEHLNALIFAPAGSLGAFLKSLQIRRGNLTAIDSGSKSCVKVCWHSDSKKIDRMFKSQVYLLNGSLERDGGTYLDKLQASLVVDSCPKLDGFNLYIQGDGTLNIPQLGKNTQCVVAGSWDGDHGTCTIKNGDQSLSIDPIAITSTPEGVTVQAQATLPCGYLCHLMSGKSSDLPITGTVRVEGSSTFGKDSCAQGTLELKNAMYGKMAHGISGTCIFNKHQAFWSGTTLLSVRDNEKMEGSWKFDESNGKGSMELYNASLFALPYMPWWTIQPKNINLTIAADCNAHIYEGSYRCTVAHKDIEDEKIETRGVVHYNLQDFLLKGNFNDMNFEVAGTTTPQLSITKGECRNNQGIQLMKVEHAQDDPSLLLGTLQVNFVQLLARSVASYNLKGEGAFEIKSRLGQDTITTDVHLAHGSLRLPYTYNVINGFDATITLDTKRQKLSIENMVSTMYRGSLICNRALLHLDDRMGIVYAHVPLLLKHCFLNFGKDLFMAVSGSALLVKKENEAPLVKGALIIENAQLKENILSNAVQKEIFQFTNDIVDAQRFDMACDISLETRSPIHVKTAFLETAAHMALSIKNTLRSPEISGSVQLYTGSMLFPYKPLNITKGSLYFVPQQSFDPIIQLVAKNKINKHNVTMTLAGSVSDPSILLESSPPLTEEQIVSLLLVGSSEESLNLAMPTFLMQNLTSLVFGKDQTSSNLDRYFQSWLKPLKNVHLVPRFTNQAQRGGLRGALEVEVNDRWKALIQKNFNLTEDTRFELEYAVSDDVTVRAIRDERRDVGGEVEMRWKF